MTLNNLESLMERIFIEKYFPREMIQTTKLGKIYIWLAKDLVLDELIWIIGNMRRI